MNYSSPERFWVLYAVALAAAPVLVPYGKSVRDTPYEYLMEYRLSNATELLVNTNLFISEITEAVQITLSTATTSEPRLTFYPPSRIVK